MRNGILYSWILLLAVSSAFGGATLLGDQGTHRTYSAQTLGHSKLVVGVSGRGAYDRNKLYGGGVVRYQLGFDTTNRVPLDVPLDTTRIDELFDLSARAFVTFGISDYFDLGFSLPVHADWLTGLSVSENADLRRASSLGVGDLEIIGKLQYPPYEHSGPYEMAFMGILTLPTGNTTKGFIPKELYYVPKDSTAGTRFYSAQMPTMAFLWLNTLDFSQINRNILVQWHLNMGLHTTSSPILDNSFLLSSSVVWKPAGNIFGLFLEFSGVTRTSNFASGFRLGDDPLFLTPGFVIDAENGVSLSLAMDWGFAPGKNRSTLRLDPEPGPRPNDPLCRSCTGNGEYYAYQIKPSAKLGASATLSWAGFLIPKDRDGDGIPDKEDACPAEVEDRDGYMDNDGCPDPDNDEDGVPDLEDKCPGQVEDMDGFEDGDGCPDPDNDGDKIADRKDKCPLEAEDYNGYQDEDGCPDGKLDADKDGIPDYADKCPAQPEDLDGYMDQDGCPELDNDNDGIPDARDRCPLAAEVVNGFEDDDGCPDQKPIEPIYIEKIIEKRDTVVRRDTVVQVQRDTVVRKDTLVIEKKAKVILHGVNFATGSAELTPESFAKLDEVARALKNSPDVVIEISGHTDNRGSPKVNMKLSKDRAEAVVRYLIAQGVPPAQLRAVGYGSSRPIASNKTAEGREKNRRIEMMRVQ